MPQSQIEAVAEKYRLSVEDALRLFSDLQKIHKQGWLENWLAWIERQSNAKRKAGR